MPRDGAITFGDLVVKLDVLRVACDKCGRKGRYAVARLIEQHGRDGKLIDWLGEITADCPKKQAGNMSDQCAARCPELQRVMSAACKSGTQRIDPAHIYCNRTSMLEPVPARSRSARPRRQMRLSQFLSPASSFTIAPPQGHALTAIKGQKALPLTLFPPPSAMRCYGRHRH
jgi:hypothetical protein